jgi:hypothetical protein
VKLVKLLFQICGLELVFNNDKKFCDFPDNVAGCK